MKSSAELFLSSVLLLAVSCVNHVRSDVSRTTVDLNRTLTNEISDTSSLHGLDRDVESYMRKWCLKGASLSVMRNDSLLYSKGYGMADVDNGIHMGPGNTLRIASVSKLITAVGIMVLKERGMLSLDSRVFGLNGILNDVEFTDAVKDRRCFDITVEDLLRHEGGFTSRYGDPMFSTLTVMMTNQLDSVPDHNELVKCILKRKLRHLPGSVAEYSNFGYLLLSMIIEKITGTDYEFWIQENVLRRAGCLDMHIAGNYEKDRYPGESCYYVQDDDEPAEEYNGSGKFVTRCYGGNDVRALSGAGAWVGSSAELALFTASIDGRSGIPDIISKESVEEMTRYYDDSTYAIGWSKTKPGVGWSRSGTMSGTTALIKYFPDGWCWVFIANTSTWKGPGQARYTKELFSKSLKKYAGCFPKRDLFR